MHGITQLRELVHCRKWRKRKEQRID